MTLTALQQARQNYIDELEHDLKIKAAELKLEASNQDVKQALLKLLIATSNYVNKHKGFNSVDTSPEYTKEWSLLNSYSEGLDMVDKELRYGGKFSLEQQQNHLKTVMNLRAS